MNIEWEMNGKLLITFSFRYDSIHTPDRFSILNGVFFSNKIENFQFQCLYNFTQETRRFRVESSLENFSYSTQNHFRRSISLKSHKIIDKILSYCVECWKEKKGNGEMVHEFIFHRFFHKNVTFSRERKWRIEKCHVKE